MRQHLNKCKIDAPDSLNQTLLLKAVKKWPKLAKIDPKMSKIGLISPKIVGVTLKILLIPKSGGYNFKILLLFSKPTGHKVPRCRHNLQGGGLCVQKRII